jgi:hypothetical protein
MPVKKQTVPKPIGKSLINRDINLKFQPLALHHNPGLLGL